MNNGKIATRYAKALLEYALEKKQEDQLYKEMKSLAANFVSQPVLHEVIKNPTISLEDKTKVIITAAGIEVSDVCQDFIRLILANRRETACYLIALTYQQLYRSHKHIVVGNLIAAHEVSEDSKEKLRSIIKESSGNDVDFMTSTDDSLIGGFILDINFMRLDASINSQLKLVKKELLEKNKSII